MIYRLRLMQPLSESFVVSKKGAGHECQDMLTSRELDVAAAAGLWALKMFALGIRDFEGFGFEMAHLSFA